MGLTLAFRPLGHATRTATLREWSSYANAFLFNLITRQPFPSRSEFNGM
ncbi:MAG: hypothetical protein F6K65_42115 [Moorea sp. SIO3C2]|nr:hypothetical protein [Moorena sp. SIO3C2]